MSTLTELQQVNLAKMAAHDAPPETRIPVNTDLRESGSTDGSTDGSTEAREEGSKEVRTDGRKEVRTDGRKAARAATSSESAAENFLTAVESALASREPLAGGVKATVDMSPELSTRAKRYLADHRGHSTRQVLIVLLDVYLTEKGY